MVNLTVKFLESKRVELSQIGHLTLDISELKETCQTLWPLVGQIFSSITYLDISLSKDVSFENWFCVILSLFLITGEYLPHCSCAE